MITVQRIRRHTWGLVSDRYDEQLRQTAKATPGMTWTPELRAWTGYADAVATTVSRLRSEAATVKGEVVVENGVPTMAIAYEGLKEHQKAGVDFLVSHSEEGCLLADEMGVMKTAQAVRAARALKTRTVVVCPSFVKGVWVDELRQWWPRAHVATLSTTKPMPIGDVDVVVIHYDVAHAWVQTILAWAPKTLIVDELHFLQGDKTRRTVSVRAIARACTYRIGLTGTPMTSRPRDMWAPLDVLSEGRLGRFFNFTERYCGGHKEQVTPTKTVWKTDGASNLGELSERLKYFMLRRTKVDVALELPPLTRQIIELDIASKFLIAPTSALRGDRMLRQSLDLSADGKIPQVIEMVCNDASQGRKVVVFAHRRAIAHAIADAVKSNLNVSVAVITGETPHDKRRAIIKLEPDVLCCTMDSVGVGVSMAYADLAFFVELHWVPSTLLQCESRLHRPGAVNPITIRYAVAKGSSDEVLRKVILEKLDRFQKSVGKLDDGLYQDLGPKEDAATRLRNLYLRMLEEDK